MLVFRVYENVDFFFVVNDKMIVYLQL